MNPKSQILDVDFFAQGEMHHAGTVLNWRDLLVEDRPMGEVFGADPILKIPHDGRTILGRYEHPTVETNADEIGALRTLYGSRVARTSVLKGVQYREVSNGVVNPTVHTPEYALLQRRANGRREVRESDFKVPHIRHALRQMLMEAVAHFEKTGAGPDLVSMEAVRQLPSLFKEKVELGVHNVMLHDGEPTLIDTGLLTSKRARLYLKFLFKHLPKFQYQLLSLVLHPYEKEAGEDASRDIPNAPVLTKWAARLLYGATRMALHLKKLNENTR